MTTPCTMKQLDKKREEFIDKYLINHRLASDGPTQKGLQAGFNAAIELCKETPLDEFGLNLKLAIAVEALEKINSINKREFPVPYKMEVRGIVARALSQIEKEI